MRSNFYEPAATGSLAAITGPHKRYVRRRMEMLTEGSRGTGEARGEVTVKHYAHNMYPACTKHGALSKIGPDVWRCLVPGCNVGCRYPVSPPGKGSA